MIKVTLLGDSIRQIGYGPVVPGLLGGDYDVWQPSENCRFAQYTLRGMYDWKGGIEGSSVVHWNNGLWDACDIFPEDGGLFTGLDFYVDTMTRIGRILTARYPKVIFATTTPVRAENPNNRTEWVERYNAAVVPELMKLGIAINDIGGAVSKDIERYICDDLIHLSKDGIDLCAGMVADSIRKAASEL